MLAYRSMTARNLSTPGIISTLELPCMATSLENPRALETQTKSGA